MEKKKKGRHQMSVGIDAPRGAKRGKWEKKTHRGRSSMRLQIEKRNDRQTRSYGTRKGKKNTTGMELDAVGERGRAS